MGSKNQIANATSNMLMLCNKAHSYGITRSRTLNKIVLKIISPYSVYTVSSYSTILY